MSFVLRRAVMKVRILSAIVMAIIGVPILIFSDTIIYPIAAGVLSLLSTWEVLRVLGARRKYTIAIPAYIVALGLPIFAYRDYFYSLYSNALPLPHHLAYIIISLLVLIVFLFCMIFAAVFTSGEVGAKDIGVVFMAVTYIVSSFTAVTLIRYMMYGEILYLFVFLCAWVSDASAYFVGTFLGKHKLTPKISPKKTVEGAVGAVICTTLACIAYGAIVELIRPDIAANYVVLGVLGAILSVISQIGDLWASLIKREYGVKDYSNIIPGHGGVFDRFDSVLAVCTVLLIICSVVPPFSAAV